MLFVIQYTIAPEHRNAAQARFQETGGPPPEGAKMLGRWHRIGGLGGFVLAESSNPVAIGKWTQKWSDLLKFEVIPVVNDEEILKVMGS